MRYILKNVFDYVQCFDCQDYFPHTNIFGSRVEIVPSIWEEYKILLCERCTRNNFIYLSHIGRLQFIVKRLQFLNGECEYKVKNILTSNEDPTTI